MADMLDMFPSLRKKSGRKGDNIGFYDLLFLNIDFDSRGAFLRITDNKGLERNVSYVNYSGELFTILRLLEQITEKKGFVIDWSGDNQRVYLAEHEYLMYLLVRYEHLRGPGNESIKYNPENAVAELHITRQGAIYESRLLIRLPDQDALCDDFKMITGNFILADRKIYPTELVSEQLNELEMFNCRISEGQLDAFLSIFYSNTLHIPVRLDGYREKNGTPIETRPTLLFEKVDRDNALYMRVSQDIPGMSRDLFSRFELTRLAEINPLERKIHIREIHQKPTEEIISSISKIIRRYGGAKNRKGTFIEDEGLFILPEEIATPFILQEVPALLDRFTIFGAEKLHHYHMRSIEPKLQFKLSSSIDFLEGDVNLEIGEERISLAEALSQFRKQHYLLLSDGTKAIVNREYMNKLERLFKKKKGNMRLSFFDLPLVEELLNEKIGGEGASHTREIFEGFNRLTIAPAAPVKVKASLRNYQEQGVKWMNYLYQNKLGGCLADDMGLGKTLQTIAMLTLVYPKTKQPSIIIMPKSLLFNWEAELKRFAPQLRFSHYYGQDRDLEQVMKSDLILTTYAMVRNDIDWLRKKKFHYIILDESQHIKNYGSQITQAVFLLEGKHRLALSGTPIENNLGELYSLFRFLNPDMFGTLEEFNTDFAIPIQKDNDKDSIHLLRKKIYPFILRRLKKDVLEELPEKIEETVFVEMSASQKALYERRRDYYYREIRHTIASKGLETSRLMLFQALNELRRIASIPESASGGDISSPKVEVLMEYLHEAVSNDHKVIVFFNYIAGLEAVSEKLDAAGIDFVSMTGSTHDRRSQVDRFQQDPDCKVFLMTLKTGGVGLNLTAADTVFIFEPWWNKASELQAVNRAHRMGQKNTVLSYSMITSGTIEEKILQLQEKKVALFDSVISSDNTSLKLITENDIEFILG